MLMTATQIDSISEASDRALEQIVDILTAAFANDPGMAFICQHKRKEYTERLRHWFLATLCMYQENHQPLLVIREASGYVACAVLTAPDTNLKPVTLLRWLWDVTRKTGVRSVWRTMAHIQRMNAHQPSTPHFRLEFVAVYPSRQGQGYGRLLLDETHRLAKTDERAVGVWLETANPALVPLYERFGYMVEHRLQMKEEIEAVLMYRANR